MEIGILLVVIYVLTPLYYGYLARNGAAMRDILWATVISLLLCAGMFFILNPLLMGLMFGGGIIFLAIAIFTVFTSAKNSDSDYSKEAKTKIRNTITILVAILSLVILTIKKHYNLE